LNLKLKIALCFHNTISFNLISGCLSFVLHINLISVVNFSLSGIYQHRKSICILINTSPSRNSLPRTLPSSAADQTWSAELSSVVSMEIDLIALLVVVDLWINSEMHEGNGRHRWH
jgi:hypothetical protein